MAFKRISEKRRSQGMCWCEECKYRGSGKVRAEWFGYGKVLCDAHKILYEPDDGHMSLADEMTWGRL